MKYELNSAQFKPMSIFFSVIFLPITMALLVYTILEFRIELLIVSLVLLCLYIFILMIVYKESKKKNNYIVLYDKHLIIKHQSLNNHKETKFLYSTIANLKYYRTTSIKSWLYSVLDGLCFLPNAVFLVYYDCGKEKEIAIGYLSRENIKQISLSFGIKLRIY